MPDEKSFESFFFRELGKSSVDSVPIFFPATDDDRSFPIDDADSITAESG